MKILLVNAFFGHQTGRFVKAEPLAICCLTAWMRKKGYNVEICDPLSAGHRPDLLISHLDLEQFQIIGISVIANRYESEVFKLVRKIRKSGFKGHICVGGQPPSLMWREYLSRCRDIDSVVIGEGEETLEDLTGILREDGDLTKVRGIAYRKKGAIQKNEPRKLIDNLDLLPFMARDVLQKYVDQYGTKVFASIIASRGCYRNCSFCSISTYYEVMNGKKFRIRSIQNIVSEINYIYREFGVHRFYLKIWRLLTERLEIVSLWEQHVKGCCVIS